MKYLIYLLVLFFQFENGLAQNKKIAFSGEISYEKKINRYPRANRILYNQKERYDIANYLSELKKADQFEVQKLKLLFSKEESLMTNKTGERNGVVDMAIDAPLSFYYRDIVKDSMTFGRTVLGEEFLVQDRALPIVWKYTDEKMNILGYECKRANGLYRDSIYVVAFYTNQIPVSIGPDSFNGLPGAILGLSLPHENISVFATEVLLKPVVIIKEKTNVKNKMTLHTYLSLLEKSFAQFDRIRINENLKTLSY